MKKKEIKIKHIEVQVGNKTISLSVDDAKKLCCELQGLLGYPQYQYIPYISYIEPQITPGIIYTDYNTAGNCLVQPSSS